MIPIEDQKNLPEDEDTPEKRADKIWNFFGKKEDGNNSMCHCCSLHKSCRVLIIHATSQLSSQIRLERGNSFRASWKTKTSWGWYSSTSQRRFRKNLRRRSINGHIPMRLISIHLTLNLHDPDCFSRPHSGDILSIHMSRAMKQTNIDFLVTHTSLVFWTISTSTWRASLLFRLLLE